MPVVRVLPVRTRDPIDRIGRIGRIAAGLLIAVSAACPCTAAPPPPAAPSTTPVATVTTSAPRRPAVEVESRNTFKVCTEDRTCIEGDSALRDIYPVPGFTGLLPIAANTLLFPRNAWVTIVASVRFADATDTYALFLTQGLEVENGEIDVSHAKAPVLGVGVYQFHHGWKLFAASPNVAKLGAYGQIALTKDDIEVIPFGPERFLLALHTGGGGQGHESDTRHLVGICTRGGPRCPIGLLGVIVTAESDCSESGKPGENWTSDVRYQPESFPPVIELRRTFRPACKPEGGVTHRDVVTYAYDGISGKYARSPK